ncbi:MAG TPA: class I SAM-dependent methyltransferase [Pyrinomonadaceae bacterium]|nr:class I SAM-dependent methyltransferase [Pyrinomonadaceae bacterium]
MTKLIRSALRVVWAAVVFVAVCLAWLILFLIFAPIILILSLIKPVSRNNDVALPVKTTEGAEPLLFDRRNDVSKLYGCNTRNVRYRWSLFETHLAELQRDHKIPAALDFGAGSLRDSYELANRGFRVTSFDLNERTLQRYFDSYDWNTTPRPTLMAGSLDDLRNLKPGSLQLVIAFDVIEHLEDPASYIRALSELLDDHGYLFTIVPNRRAFFERYFKRSLAHQLKRGAVLEPGVPHIQFKSPDEWDQFFQANGFRIVARDMTIGHFVNDWWNGLIAIPLRTYVYPVLQVVAFRGKFELDAGKIESTLCAPWLMERVNVLDQLLKNSLRGRFGWNLIVAQKQG